MGYLARVPQSAAYFPGKVLLGHSYTHSCTHFLSAVPTQPHPLGMHLVHDCESMVRSAPGVVSMVTGQATLTIPSAFLLEEGRIIRTAYRFFQGVSAYKWLEDLACNTVVQSAI